jgi:hypothetical protein
MGGRIFLGILDRRLPAIVVIALIMATIVSYFILEEIPDESITVIRNSAPDQIRRQVDLELTHKFSLGLITRKSIEELVIQYLFLTLVQKLPPLNNSESWEDRIALIHQGRALLAGLGYRPDLIQGTFEDDMGETDYMLNDFGVSLPIFTDWKLAEDATTSHLIIPANPRENENATLYAGKSGFYYFRGDLAKVIVSRGGNETIYTAQRSAQELQEGERKIDKAPHNGRIILTDLSPDESISIIIEVMGRADQRRGSLSIILIYVDGALEDTLFNFID